MIVPSVNSSDQPYVFNPTQSHGLRNSWLHLSALTPPHFSVHRLICGSYFFLPASLFLPARFIINILPLVQLAVRQAVLLCCCNYRDIQDYARNVTGQSCEGVCVFVVLFLSEKCWQQLNGKSQNPPNPAVNCESVWSCWSQLDGILSEHLVVLIQCEIK